MQKFVKHIMAIMLAGLFLVSFTGVRLLIHHCMACDTSSLYVFADTKSCCEYPASHNAELLTCSFDAVEQNACCTGETTEETCDNCCDNEIVYVKNDYEVSHERQVPRVEPVLVETEVLIHSLLSTHLYKGENVLFSSTVDPPPRKVARDFILFAHQLKIC